jgi:hypothetical protein
MCIGNQLDLALVRHFLYNWIMYDDPEVGELYNIWDRQFFVAPEVSVPPPQIRMDGPPQAVIQRIEEPEKEKQKELEPFHDFEFIELSDAEKND